MAIKDYALAAKQILDAVGGSSNVSNCANCMTRVRFVLKDASKVNKTTLDNIEGVLQVISESNLLQVVVGPGVSAKVTTEINKLLSTNTTQTTTQDNKLSIDDDWKANKAKVKEKQKRFAWLSKGMKHLANIFTPLIPAIIAAGLFAALASITKQVGGTTITTLDSAGNPVISWIAFNGTADVFFNIFTAFSNGFTAYLVIFVGINAAREFGANAMLGGFLGGICSMGNITAIAKIIHLYNTENELASTLLAGKGGVIGVIAAVYLLSLVEKFLHKKMPNSLDTVFTPFLSILIVGSVYVFGIMIVAGYISDGICWVIGQLTMNENVFVRIIIGFISAALFLPLVMTGMHHGLVAFYATELVAHHYVSLYPVLAMAGAGQVGAAIALYIKSRKVKNERLQRNITSSIIPGVLGVGEPLIYSVTLPLGMPFITAGLGAGIGGAFLMAFRVGSTAWGPSGFLAIPLMTYVNGKENMLGLGLYSIGLIISIIGGFIFTWFIIKEKRVMPAVSAATN